MPSTLFEDALEAENGTKNYHKSFLKHPVVSTRGFCNEKVGALEVMGLSLHWWAKLGETPKRF